MKSSGVIRYLFSCSLLTLVVFGPVSGESRAQEVSAEDNAYFEQHVRPLLVKHCQDCHGPKKQWAELRLDTAAGLRKGGESGPVVVAGKPDESELLLRISNEDVDLRMPPEESGPPLTAAQIAVISQWIKTGAAWPESAEPSSAETARAAQRRHWAFQPVKRPAPPAVVQTDWPRGAIDQFILARLEAEGLPPSPAADRRTLIRRAAYDLTGLPPTAEEVAEFERDDSGDAYKKLIDRLLESPRYGEQWGRHWLDVARFSDIKGYVYGREERRFVHSSHYRDWVIQAFNDDLPYDRFVLLQLAADQAAQGEPRDLAAMGYLTLGRRFLGVTPDIIDDRIDVVGRGLLGLTISCARCHDHKYDPIPTADYYSMYGVFQNCTDQLVPIPRQPDAPLPTPGFEKALQASKDKLRDVSAGTHAAGSERIRNRIADYLLAQYELDKYPALTFNRLLGKNDLVPTIVRRWETYLLRAQQQRDPVFVPWLAYAELAEADFSKEAIEVTQRLKDAGDKINPRIAAAFAEPPASRKEVADRYQQVLSDIDREWTTLCAGAKSAGKPIPQKLADPHDEALRRVLYGPSSPCVIPDVPIVNSEPYWDIGTIKSLWKLQSAVDQQILTAPEAAPHAVVLNDAAEIIQPRIFRRGDPTKPGDSVPLQFLEVIAGANRQPFSHGSGRLEMAQAIIDPKNPLTARVWVNRVWMHHFGQGLVPTPSDFGMRASPPSHPELLDWLASEFIAHDWSTKWLHRTIMDSATYQQMSTPPRAETVIARAQQRDPNNRLLSRMNPHRLTFEQFRDTLLALSGELDLTMGGRGVEMFAAGSSSKRRSVYGLVDRQFLPSLLRVFDFANPDLHVGERAETTSPQQALYALNGDLLVGRAQTIVKRLGGANQALPDEQVRQLYQVIFQRDPSSIELDRAVAFLQPASANENIAQRKLKPSGWSYGYGEIDPDAQELNTFTRIPFFTGDAWVGGPSWPDAKIGYVQLTAAGGHPGNDLQHAVVRRWTAPAKGSVSLQSEFIHQPSHGDGVRYWVLSSRHGVLKTGLVHASRQPVNVEAIDIQAGDTLDFAVDIYGGLGHDQFLWSPKLKLTSEAAAGTPEPQEFNATKDFTEGASTLGTRPRSILGTKPTLWELTHSLLMSNELMFVD